MCLVVNVICLFILINVFQLLLSDKSSTTLKPISETQDETLATISISQDEENEVPTTATAEVDEESLTTPDDVNMTSTEEEEEVIVDAGSIYGDDFDTKKWPDPEVDEGVAMAAAWIRSDDGSTDIEGEIFLIQYDNKSTETILTGWFDNLEPYTDYILTIVKWGDMTDDSCDGPQYYDKSQNNSFWFQFSTHHELYVDFNESDTVYNVWAPLYGGESVIGRTMVLMEKLGHDEEHIHNRTLMYLPPNSNEIESEEFFTNTLGCGIIGFANDFILYLEDENNRGCVIRNYAIFAIILILINLF